jgi:outer membrane protein, multidrug efflux system
MFLLPVMLAVGMAQAATPLTLEEAAALAAGEAPAVVRTRAETERARAQSVAARSRLGPALSADLGFFGTDDPAGVFRLALQQERFSAAGFFASDPNDAAFTRDWNAAISAEWTVDLFGAGRGEARAAEQAAVATDRTARRTRDAAAFQAIAAFGAARAAEEALALLLEREADARRDVEIATSLEEQGMVTPADPARAKAALAELYAEAAGHRAALADARATLATLIGPEAAGRSLAPLPPPGPTPAAAVAPRDDVAAAELAARSARERYGAASASRWPSLLVSGRYEMHAERPGARWGNSATVFGGLRIPIFASGRINSRILEARAVVESAEASALETRRAAEKEVLSARAALAAAEARRAAFGEAEAAARTAREIQEARYGEGASRLADLIEARAAELRARLGASTADSERTIAEAYLRLALGLPPEGGTR